MFELVKKIVLLCSLTAGVMLSSAVSAHAQKIEAEVKSAADFAREHGGSQYADVLNKEENKKTVVCGNASTFCNTETELCLKCVVQTSHNGVATNQEYGKCVNKSQYDPQNPKASWPDDGNCLGKMKIFMGGYTISAGVISLESVGFLSKNTMDTLFYHSEKGHSFADNDGKKYKLLVSQNPTVVYGGSNDGDAFDGCEVLPVKLYNMQGCFFCPLAGLIYSAANDVTASAFASFAAPFRNVMIIVFALWLALVTLGQVFPMTKQDAPKFLAAILKQGFKVMFAFALLFYANDLFRYFVVPLLDGGLKLGVGIQTVSMPEPTNYKKTDITTVNEFYNIHKEGEDSLYERIEKYLASLQARLSYVQAIGTTIFCVGSHKITLWKLVTKLSEFKAGLRMMFLGGVLTSFSFLLTMAFAFYFLDALLQLAVIGVMLPFMIAGWPFRATAQYAGTGLKMLLNTFFVLFFTGFVVSVNVELINKSLAFSQDNNEEEITEEKQQINSGFQTITSAINEQNWNALDKATDIGGAGFLLLAFGCIFGFKFVGQVTPLASKLSAGGFGKGGIAGKIGTMAASATKGMATKAASPVGRALGGMAMDGAVGVVGLPEKVLGAVGGGLQFAGDALAEKGHGKLAAAAKGAGAVAGFGRKLTSLPRKAVGAVRDEAKSKK